MNTKLLISLWGRLTNRLFHEGRQNDVPSEPTHSLRKDITEKIDVKTENLEKWTIAPIASILHANSLDRSRHNQIFLCTLGATQELIKPQKNELAQTQSNI